jgi:hypothetical protein
VPAAGDIHHKPGSDLAVSRNDTYDTVAREHRPQHLCTLRCPASEAARLLEQQKVEVSTRCLETLPLGKFIASKRDEALPVAPVHPLASMPKEARVAESLGSPKLRHERLQCWRERFARSVPGEAISFEIQHVQSNSATNDGRGSPGRPSADYYNISGRGGP